MDTPARPTTAVSFPLDPVGGATKFAILPLPLLVSDKIDPVSDRYSRQILFSGIGAEGQRKIELARVVLVGCGALGTVSAELLVRAGVGHLQLIDRDFVEESNLQRQSLFTESDVRAGLPKAIAAQTALQSINSQVGIEGIVQDLSFENVEDLCRKADIIVDGTDNFETRYLINDFAVKVGKPWVYGACVASYGTAFLVRPGSTSCLQCLFPEPPPLGSVETCDTAGVIGPVVHAVASFQIAQTLKVLVGLTPEQHLLKVDVWEDHWHLLSAAGARNQECACCSRREFRFLEALEKSNLMRLCGRDAVQVHPGRMTQLDFPQLSQRLEKTGTVRYNEHMMRIRINGYEIALFPDGRSIIKGTKDFSEARAVYARYIGS